MDNNAFANVFRYRINGSPFRPLADLYFFLLAEPWWRLLPLAFGAYLAINLLFAGLFTLGGDCVAGAQPGAFDDAFWFSVQTFSTIGYGGMSPKTPYAHALVTLESFAGLIGVAFGTGLLFAKFARPSARVGFSRNLVVAPRNGTPSLQLRIANARCGHMINARMSVSALMEEVTSEGAYMRRLVDLRLERATSPLFALAWTIIHTLDQDSPLHGLTAADVEQRVLAVVVSFEAVDDTFMQVVHASHFYRPQDILFDACFVDMIRHPDNLTVEMDYARLHDIRPIHKGEQVADPENDVLS